MKYCDYVNIRQGSDSVRRFSNGNTLPLVQLPFGMIAFAPQTSENNVRWFYHPQSRAFEGVRLTHQPSPWIGDHGAVCFMPQNGLLGFNGDERWSGFRPEDTVLKPYYLSYDLLRSRSRIEVTTTERCAAMRISFRDDGDNYFCVHSVEGIYEYLYNEDKNTLFIVTDNCAGGEHKNFHEFVAVKFPEGAVDADGIIVQCDYDREKGKRISADNAAIYIKLRNKVTEVIIGSSYLAPEQSLVNIEREAKNKSFDDIMNEAEAVWEEYLSRVEIEAKDEEQMKTFYSCMYRAFLYPHKCSEIAPDGTEIHYCPHDGRVHEGVRYTDNGFWDTYRTVYPFFSLVAKDELKLMLKSFIREYEESGWLPRWLAIGENGCMPSTLVDAVICDGAVKGFIDDDDLALAFEGMKNHANKKAPNDNFGRTGVEKYCELGYVPYDFGESVNLTEDAAYGDWCIAEVAKLLGKEKSEAKYRERAKNYRNLFDAETGFMRPKDAEGNFRPDFSPVGWGRDYTEGSAWQNSFAVPHDIEGLAELYGGKEKLLAKIDELFATAPEYDIVGYGSEIHEITEMAAADLGQCAISNQPSFHIPYIYSALGDVEKTAYWVEKICRENFSWKDDGFPGDEDNGTMAIWYIFGVLGLYPFCPGKPEFVKGKKQVISAKIMGKDFDADSFEGNIIPYSAVTE